MLNARLKALIFRLVMATIFFALGGAAFAAASGTGVGAVAANVTTNLTNIAKLITAGSYVAGMAFAVGAIAKFKQHKENPQQMPLSTPIVLLFIGIALIFIPAIFKTGGGTLFGSSGTKSSISGLTSF
ncbi:MAG TPA: type IV secretion protein IcmD [Gammaproteobacteria bacterium]|nr:type IV secretion protein IcmD [Gammaproteobacteria bacterium]